MKICLINLPISHFRIKKEKPNLDSFFIGIPLGILYIAAVLRQKGHIVYVLDCVMDSKAQFNEYGKELTYGIPPREIHNRLKDISPEIIGLSCQFTVNANSLYRVSKVAKYAWPEIPLIIGGPHASVADKELLQTCKDIDIIVRGEGEDTVIKLMDFFEGIAKLDEIRGITYRLNGDVVQNQKTDVLIDLDKIPFPAYDLIDMNSYLGRGKHKAISRIGEGKKPFISMITSRGCPFNCVFCSIHLTMSRRWRGHSPEYVLDHIKFLKDTYGVDSFHFEDDSILNNKERFKTILNLLIEKNMNIHWDTPNGVRADHLDSEIVQLMKPAGCLQITMGIESGNQKVLDKIIRKRLKLETVENVAKICQKYSIPLGGFFVIGFPGETKKDIQDTIRFGLYLAKKYKVKIGGAMIATPLLGTDLFKICKEDKLLTRDATPENFYHATGKEGWGMIRTSEFTPEELKKMNGYFVRRTYAIILFRALTHPSELYKLIKNIGSLKKAILYLRRLFGFN